MGLWLDNNRHGNGIIVTIDGLYFEGTFVQNNILVGLVAPQPSAVQLLYICTVWYECTACQCNVLTDIYLTFVLLLH